ncbi:hypothetical protein EXIGLDRAFT_754868 [Exidia glandulosa HHB12029]|uniref:Uncharacterized protein n=1 Tax=Exidia glandulosa HHB12029 TaxID=1314781 RepID=A0A165CII2_EXIGL|nr:hypothetical protein EXIGLDRAFT_754868 [Exidia glandulosa HHB12029]
MHVYLLRDKVPEERGIGLLSTKKALPAGGASSTYRQQERDVALERMFGNRRVIAGQHTTKIQVNERRRGRNRDLRENLECIQGRGGPMVNAALDHRGRSTSEQNLREVLGSVPLRGRGIPVPVSAEDLEKMRRGRRYTKAEKQPEITATMTVEAGVVAVRGDHVSGRQTDTGLFKEGLTVS